MRSSRCLTRASRARRWKGCIPPPHSPRPVSTSAPAPEYTTSFPLHYQSNHNHNNHHYPPSRTLASDTETPPTAQEDRTYPTTEQLIDEDASFEQIHRSIWRGHLRGPSRSRESKRHLVPASNETCRRLEDARGPRPWRELDWNNERVWKKGLQRVRSGDWHYQSASAPIPQLLHYKTVDEVRLVWAEQDANTARGEWAPVLLSLLATDLRQACLFLQAVYPLSEPPLAALSDAIIHIYTALEGTHAPRYREHVAEHLCDAVIYLLREHPDAGRDLLRQQDIYMLQKQIPPRRLDELYDELREAGVELNSYTLMHVASSLARDPALKRKALEIMAVGLARLRSGAEGGHADQDVLRRRRWASVFTTILMSTRLSVTAARDVISPDEVWDFAVENGITPNTIQLTALVQSLCAIGRVDAAWQAFDMFSHGGNMRVDLKLSSTLLQGSKLSGSLPHILRALELIAETREVDAIVGNNILHLVLTLAMSDSARGKILSSFPLLLRVYSRMFRPEALEAMIPARLRDVVDLDAALEDVVLVPGFASSLEKLFKGWRGGLLEPTPATLEVMVLSWICSLKRGFKGPALIAFYGHYRAMLRERHPVAVEMVKTRNSVIHDMIIKEMSSSPANLRTALEVIADMLRDHEEPPGHHHHHHHHAAKGEKGAAAAAARLVEEAAADGKGKEVAAAATATATEDKAPAAAPAAADPVHPRPSSWTWNILLDAWMRHFKQDNVGRIVSLMKRHGVEPSLVTWNTILSRAAQRKNTQLAVRSAQEIREGGYEPNEWTVRAFSRLAEKEMFLTEMQGGKWMGGGLGHSGEEGEAGDRGKSDG